MTPASLAPNDCFLAIPSCIDTSSVVWFSHGFSHGFIADAPRQFSSTIAIEEGLTINIHHWALFTTTVHFHWIPGPMIGLCSRNVQSCLLYTDSISTHVLLSTTRDARSSERPHTCRLFTERQAVLQLVPEND